MTTYILLTLSTVENNNTSENSSFCPVPSDVGGPPRVLLTVYVKSVEECGAGNETGRVCLFCKVILP